MLTITNNSDKLNFQIRNISKIRAETLGNFYRRVLMSEYESYRPIGIYLGKETNLFSTIDNIVEDNINLYINITDMDYNIESDEKIIIVTGEGKEIRLTHSQHTISDKVIGHSLENNYQLKVALYKNKGHSTEEENSKILKELGMEDYISLDSRHSTYEKIYFNVEPDEGFNYKLDFYFIDKNKSPGKTFKKILTGEAENIKSLIEIV